MNQNVKFLFGGKIYQNDSIMITEITNPPFGKTLNAMLNPIAGGRKTIKTRKTRKKIIKKTKKHRKKYYKMQKLKKSCKCKRNK